MLFYLQFFWLSLLFCLRNIYVQSITMIDCYEIINISYISTFIDSIWKKKWKSLEIVVWQMNHTTCINWFFFIHERLVFTTFAGKKPYDMSIICYINSNPWQPMKIIKGENHFVFSNWKKETSLQILSKRNLY